MQFRALFYTIVITLNAIPLFSQNQDNSRDPAENKLTDEEAIEIFMTTRRSKLPVFTTLSEKENDNDNDNETINDYYDRLIDEHYIRMQTNAAKLRENQKLRKLPKYSDTSYFGHDKKPKKRKRGKRKYCEECGIVH
ncbi:hypothetical protein OO013_11415 [Mangrovivirga sp. M17]|uniref:Uncharacterized protein n=1 Tax=Mangrovivirga halotolerans TaxID=2993936 RepID=A0ABT3RSZ6_9BACT|nr:hypothetical protein [Mangrovivirga halotolerans]MCX2744478.1 hypothetical protein [Mangrovivirga halotolerans]